MHVGDEGDGEWSTQGPCCGASKASSGAARNYSGESQLYPSRASRLQLLLCTVSPKITPPGTRTEAAMAVADLLLHKTPRRAPGRAYFAIARRYSIMYYSTSSSQRNCGAVVVGGGPAGITVLGNLLEQQDKLPAQRLFWVDPHFRAGRVNARYREVPRSVSVPVLNHNSLTPPATPPSSCSCHGPKPPRRCARSSRRPPSPMPPLLSASCPRTRAVNSARPPTCA